MKKEKPVIGILIALIVLIVIFASWMYIKNTQLKSLNNQLEADRAQLSTEKEQVITEKEQCISDSKDLKDDMDMLQQDCTNLEKTCPTNNACKGHFPGISWKCNNVGDLADDNASHICSCDASCQLNATQITNI